jgi:hypothetical protein
VLGSAYLHDRLVNELEPTAARLDFDLPEIAGLALDHGVKPLRDALRRKRLAPRLAPRVAPVRTAAAAPVKKLKDSIKLS